MSKINRRPTVIPPGIEEDKAIAKAARSDPDAQPLSPAQLRAMAPMTAMSHKGVPPEKPVWGQFFLRVPFEAHGGAVFASRVLEKLAEEALAEFQAGKTRPLDDL